MKIDVYTHILPEKYFKAFRQKCATLHEGVETRYPAVIDLNVRLRLMDRHPDVMQVLTVAQPPLDVLVPPKDAAELARIANDELAELVVKYPDKFVAAAACLPLNDVDAALVEIDRAITQLELRGIQIYSPIKGESLDNPKFKPIYEKMADYDLPIWIHPNPTMEQNMSTGVWGLEVLSSMAMEKLVSSRVFDDYPNIKFIIHHCGAMVPLLEGRLKWGPPPKALGEIRNPVEYYKKFYTDTATYGITGPMMLAYGFFDVDHILFGTDTPLGPKWGITMESIKAVERMSIPDADKEAIFVENAIKLLKLVT